MYLMTGFPGEVETHLVVSVYWQHLRIPTLVQAGLVRWSLKRNHLTMSPLQVRNWSPFACPPWRSSTTTPAYIMSRGPLCLFDDRPSHYKQPNCFRSTFFPGRCPFCARPNPPSTCGRSSAASRSCLCYLSCPFRSSVWHSHSTRPGWFNRRVHVLARCLLHGNWHAVFRVGWKLLHVTWLSLK